MRRLLSLTINADELGFHVAITGVPEISFHSKLQARDAVQYAVHWALDGTPWPIHPVRRFVTYSELFTQKPGSLLIAIPKPSDQHRLTALIELGAIIEDETP